MSNGVVATSSGRPFHSETVLGDFVVVFLLLFFFNYLFIQVDIDLLTQMITEILFTT